MDAKKCKVFRSNVPMDKYFQIKVRTLNFFFKKHISTK